MLWRFRLRFGGAGGSYSEGEEVSIDSCSEGEELVMSFDADVLAFREIFPSSIVTLAGTANDSFSLLARFLVIRCWHPGSMVQRIFLLNPSIRLLLPWYSGEVVTMFWHFHPAFSSKHLLRLCID